MDSQTLHQQLLAVDLPLSHIPAIELSQAQAHSVKQGQQISISSQLSGQVRIYCDAAFLGLGEIPLNGKLAPKKLFHLDNSVN